MFDKTTQYIDVPSNSMLRLRPVSPSDLEFLRLWKNENRQFFFNQEIITAGQQKLWYELFLDRPYDLMFIAEYGGQAFGCMGIRWLDNHWDIYNVIRGVRDHGNRGLIGQAFDALLAFAQSLRSGPMTLQVLKHNPAVSWYKKHGLRIVQTHETYYLMLHQPLQA